VFECYINIKCMQRLNNVGLIRQLSVVLQPFHYSAAFVTSFLNLYCAFVFVKSHFL
jgi:hypothetical protein